jgi:hypothetical protein
MEIRAKLDSEKLEAKNKAEEAMKQIQEAQEAEENTK